MWEAIKAGAGAGVPRIKAGAGAGAPRIKAGTGAGDPTENKSRSRSL